jgi:molybdate transport system substrate-binding protein
MRAKVIALATASGLFLMPLFGAAGAAEIKVMYPPPLRTMLSKLIPQFERASGHKLVVTYESSWLLVARIQKGETPDVAFLTARQADELVKEGKLARRVDLVRSSIGIAVRADALKPDIGSVEAFKQALLAAKSIAYIDPAAGGSSGIYVAGLLDKLGIAAEVKAKSKLIPGSAVAEHIARGEAELGIHQISEILPVKGVTLVGPLPADIQNYTIYAAGIGTSAKEPDAANALLKALAGPGAAEVLKSKGMDPP